MNPNQLKETTMDPASRSLISASTFPPTIRTAIRWKSAGLNG